MTRRAPLLLALCSLLFAVAASAATIPAANLPPRGFWEAGIPGGIPTNLSWFADVSTYGAVADDTGDDSGAFLNALRACPADSYVSCTNGTTFIWSNAVPLLGTNTYDGVDHPVTAVLRGRGPSSTWIRVRAGTGASFSATPANGWTLQATLSGTLDRGATNGTITGDTGNEAFYAVGKYIAIGLPQMEEPVKITSRSGGDITWEPPLLWGKGSSCSVWARVSVPTRCGLEDLTIANEVDNNNYTILWNGAAECWTKNIVVSNAIRGHVRFQETARCEAYQTYVHDSLTQDASGDHDYGFSSLGMNSGILVWNCISDYVRHNAWEQGTILSAVVGNYFIRPVQEQYLSSTANQNDGTHGGTNGVSAGAGYGIPNCNLWERNIIDGRLCFDNATGAGSSNSVALRNWVRRVGLPSVNTNTLTALEAQWNNYGVVFAGNLIGTPGQSVDAYDWDGANQSSVRRIGWFNDSGETTTIDTNVAFTMTYAMNTDFLLASNNCCGTIDLPATLLYPTNASPSWWPAWLDWTSFDPSATSTNNLRNWASEGWASTSTTPARSGVSGASLLSGAFLLQ